jgi:hypothetical protein
MAARSVKRLAQSFPAPDPDPDLDPVDAATRSERISSKVMISSNSAGACRARHRVCAGYGASNYPNSAILTLVILSVAKDL